MNKTFFKIRVFLWLILGIIISWFVYMKIVPSGSISYIYNFSRPSYFIGKLAPEERVITKETGAEIKGDPIYFSLKPSRRFEHAKVTIKFKNNTTFPIMEIGLLNNKNSWSYDLKPLQNKIIDQLLLVWQITRGEDDIKLIQREKKYNTVEEFSNNLPVKDKIALYNYSLKDNFLIGNYKPTQENNIINYKFRGSYQFYTYIKQEELNYNFNFSDLNINADEDPVEIKIYSGSKEIYSIIINDKNKDEVERQASIKMPDLPEGVYRFSIIVNDDIITDSIKTKQSQFSLINKIWLAEGNKNNIILFTNSRLVNAQTINPASAGRLKIGDNFLDIEETYRQFSMKTLVQPVKIELYKDDMIISGDGVFSFSEDSLLDPSFKNISESLDIKNENIEYVLTNYETPIDYDGWQIASADFDLTKAYQEKGKYQFLISIPSLKAEEFTQGQVIIKEIKVDLYGTSLKEKIKKYF